MANSRAGDGRFFAPRLSLDKVELGYESVQRDEASNRRAEGLYNDDHRPRLYAARRRWLRDPCAPA